MPDRTPLTLAEALAIHAGIAELMAQLQAALDRAAAEVVALAPFKVGDDAVGDCGRPMRIRHLSFHPGSRVYPAHWQILGPWLKKDGTPHATNGTGACIPVRVPQ
jgi:hypothetical protein